MRLFQLSSKLLIFFLISFSVKSYAQEEHHHHVHDHNFEFGLANSVVYFVNEKEIAYGLHFHLVKRIAHSKFGFGLGYERIFDEHKHNTIGIVGAYNPIYNLHLAISPGVAFEGSGLEHPRFAIHFESVYDWQIGEIHLGPLLEFAYDQEDYHISLGIHIGFGI